MSSAEHDRVTTTTRALITFTVQQLHNDDLIDVPDYDRSELIDALTETFDKVLRGERERHAAEKVRLERIAVAAQDFMNSHGWYIDTDNWNGSRPHIVGIVGEKLRALRAALAEGEATS